MIFYLGSHHATQRWFDLDVPLFVSRRVLTERKRLPEARTSWALDSGGFTELSLYGKWRTTPAEYRADVGRFESEVGQLAWVAPQDWMCEPHMLEKTGLSVAGHQHRTVTNFLSIAFGSLAFFWGQFWAKFTAVCVGVILTAARRWKWPVRQTA